MSLEKVVLLKQSDRTFLLLWAGLASLAHLDGSLNCTFGSWPKEGVQICSRVRGVSSQTLLVLTWYRGKNAPLGFCSWTDEDMGLFVS